MLGKDMMFFNGEVWKSLSEYTDGDMAMQYNEDGTAHLVKPSGYRVVVDSKSLYRIGSDTVGTVFMVSDLDTKLPFKYFDFYTVSQLISAIKKNGFVVEPIISNYKYLSGSDSLYDSVLARIVANFNMGTFDFNEYVLLDKDGCVTFSDKIFNLSSKNRKKLLSMLRLYYDRVSLFQVGKESKEALSKLISLWNMTYDKGIYYDENIDALVTQDSGGYGVLDISGTWLRKSYDKVKYSLEVPSGMLIVKCGLGVPFVVSTN